MSEGKEDRPISWEDIEPVARPFPPAKPGTFNPDAGQSFTEPLLFGTEGVEVRASRYSSDPRELVESLAEDLHVASDKDNELQMGALFDLGSTLHEGLQGKNPVFFAKLLRSALDKFIKEREPGAEYQYLNMMQNIYTHGVDSPDRTNTGKRTSVCEVAHYDMEEGFPVLTTKKVKWEWSFEETLAFIKGVTDNTYFKDRGVPIWNHWELKEDQVEIKRLTTDARLDLLAMKKDLSRAGLDSWFDTAWSKGDFHKLGISQTEFMEGILRDEGIPTEETVVIRKAGELGPVYGAMWRSWPSLTLDEHGKWVVNKPIDQLANLIEGIKTNPYSRRHLISGWNPSLLPDEGKPGTDQTEQHQTNIKNGKQVLPPCHTLFQVSVLPLSFERRIELLRKSGFIGSTEGWLKAEGEELEAIKEVLRIREIPEDSLDLTLVQRSGDVPVGVPFNVAGYSLILRMLCHSLNKHPGTFHHVVIDAHIYHNQFEGVLENLSRTPGKLPKLLINPNKKDFFDLEMDDFKLIGYNPQAFIKFPVAI